MVVMQANLFPMLLSSLNKAFIVFFIVASAKVTAQSSVVRIKAPELNGIRIRCAFPRGVVMRSDIPRFRMVNENGEITIQREVEDYDVLQLSYGDAFKDVIMQPGDSMELFWNREYRTWEFLKSSDSNKQIDSLNTIVNQWIIKLAYSRNTAGTLSFIQSKIDSLKAISSSNPNEFLSIYQWYAAADLDLMLNPQALNSLRSVYFKGKGTYPMHPAWIFSFNSFFEGDILKRLSEQNGQNLRKSIESEQWQSVEAIFLQDSTINDTSLLKWVVLKDIYELSNTKDFQLKQLYNLLKSGLNMHATDSMFAKELGSILEKWGPHIKGNSFPDFKVSTYKPKDKEKSFKELIDKPIYLTYLPNREVNSILVLKQLSALQSKYGKEIQFVVFIPEIQDDDHLLNEQGYSGLQFLSVEFSAEDLLKLFPDSDQAGFALIDRSFNTYSFPAEGPETGVESSFLGLIKK